MGEKVLFAGQPFELEGTPRRVGDAAPDFVLTGQDLAPVSSERLHGKVRVYSVFPSIDTPVCSLQNIRFNREAAALGDEVTIVAISVDFPLRRSVSARPRASTASRCCRTISVSTSV